jgi:hypothetical protein
LEIPQTALQLLFGRVNVHLIEVAEYTN